MTDSEWIANIHNISNAEIFEQLEQCGCDGYYRDIWSACIEELRRRLNLTSGDLISREALKEQVKNLLNLAVKRVDDTPTTSPCYRMYVAQENERARLVDLIDNAPPAPDRQQGEWIIVKDEKYGDNVKCPFCGKELAGTDLNFCCKCGADMRNTAKPTKEVIEKLGECKCNTCKHNGTWACNNCHCFDKYMGGAE